MDGLTYITPDGAGVIATVIPVLLVVTFIDREFIRRQVRGNRHLSMRLRLDERPWLRVFLPPAPVAIAIITALVLAAILVACWGVASGEGVHGAAALLVWFVLFYEALTVIVAAMAQARQRQRDEH
ncbi:hypothetical protein [Cellulomonas chitinilytica]|uniref:hypothetical protein n=1 Tax=Cellulomonas chitinilytica TaxID=398759 RepID=UPI0019428C1D|nr:hypothetical protein [Cellulomonas chitinilytica]